MTDPYEIAPRRLRFADPRIEQRYREDSLERLLPYGRAAWTAVPVLALFFGFFDHAYFGENTGTVRVFRAAIVLFALAVLGASYLPALARFRIWSSALFTGSIGLFCTALVALDSPDHFSPYFVGMLTAFAGVFSLPGVGTSRSTVGLLGTFAVFNGVLLPAGEIPLELMVAYDLFLATLIFIFFFASYLVESAYRQSWARAQQLEASLAEVQTLSGLLPICSSCKRIRDDQGYWEQIEKYISSRSGARFSHSICEPCARELYPSLYPDEPPETAGDEPGDD
ncbi:MAG: hypothetical protein P1V51_12010 [Deltaproteobacteria bacterium]|nr:hypothetical protein [Deltaproteobacteria bacterium]